MIEIVCVFIYGTTICLCMHARMLNHVSLSAAPQTVAHLPPLAMGFPRKEYENGLLFPAPGDLPSPGIKQASLTSPALLWEILYH